jgi:uncharacterized protein (TIGR00730 family)
MQTIGIYCSASVHIRPVFNESAEKLGIWMGKKGMTLVNGGSNQGLMAIFSKTIRENGGRCVGVVPTAFKKRGWYNEKNDETIFVENLSDRKEIIKKTSDLLIVFPGGVGSMDELFDAWASYNLDFHSKKIILANIDGFYNPLLSFLDILKKENFMHDFLPKPVIVADSVEQCIEIIETINSDKNKFEEKGFRIY